LRVVGVVGRKDAAETLRMANAAQAVLRMIIRIVFYLFVTAMITLVSVHLAL
jgi:hypothetical protein